MVKVYKAEFYIVDVNDDYQGINDIKEKIEESPTFRWAYVHVADVEDQQSLSGMMI